MKTFACFSWAIVAAVLGSGAHSQETAGQGIVGGVFDAAGEHLANDDTDAITEPGSSGTDAQICTTWIRERVAESAKPRGRGHDISFDPHEVHAFEFTKEEQKRLAEGKWAGGKITCPAAVTLDKVLETYIETLASDLEAMETDTAPPDNRLAIEEQIATLEAVEKNSLCLIYDPETQSYAGFQTGQRDAYLECRNPRTFCDRFKSLKDETISAAGTVAGGLLANGILAASGGAVASNGTGALIFTGPGGYVAGTLGTVGAGLAASPLALGAALAIASGAGGAALLCD